MAYKTLTIRESTYNQLKGWKEGGESFSDMLDREIGRRIQTAQDMLEMSKLDREAGYFPLAQRADSPHRRKK